MTEIAVIVDRLYGPRPQLHTITATDTVQKRVPLSILALQFRFSVKEKLHCTEVTYPAGDLERGLAVL